jgi:hypothetical protein
MALSPGKDTLLGIYLNDHLAGATGGVELIQRLARAEKDWSGGETLRQLAAEVKVDRQTLLKIMADLEVKVRRYKTVAAWTAEKAGRLKLNGHLVTRSPLARLEELEIMRLGVEGKAACWRTLRTRAEDDPRLDKAQLDDLLARADGQIKQLEDMRITAAAGAFVRND